MAKKCPRCNARVPPPAGDEAPICPSCGLTVWAQGTRPPRRPWLPQPLKTGLVVFGTAGLASAALLLFLLAGQRREVKVGAEVRILGGSLVADNELIATELLLFRASADEGDFERLSRSRYVTRLAESGTPHVKVLGFGRSEAVAEVEILAPRHWRGWVMVDSLY